MFSFGLFNFGFSADQVDGVNKCYFCSSCTASQADAHVQECEKYYGFKIPYSCQVSKATTVKDPSPPFIHFQPHVCLIHWKKLTAFVADDADPEEDWFIWGGICMPTSLCESNSTKISGYTVHFDCCSKNLCNTYKAAYKMAKRRRRNQSTRLESSLHVTMSLLGGLVIQLWT